MADLASPGREPSPRSWPAGSRPRRGGVTRAASGPGPRHGYGPSAVTIERSGGLERALAPVAPYVAGLAAAYAALSVFLWLAGEITGWLWTRRWPPAGIADALSVPARLLSDPAQPAQAWPVAARHDLPPAPLFYAVALVLVAAIATPAARLVMTHAKRGRSWSNPNPR